MLGAIRRSAAAHQRGLSLIELMIGIAIGMIVVAGASLLMTNQINEHGRLMQETQMQQDLRATAELITRDLRRAGYWKTPEQSVWQPTGAAVQRNEYTEVEAPEANDVTYNYAKGTEDNAVTDNEVFGFRLRNGVLYSQLGLGNWQPLTDANAITIIDLQLQPRVQPIALANYCSPPCPPGAACPQLQVRSFDITITAASARDSRVTRTIRTSSRLRNDNVTGACP